MRRRLWRIDRWRACQTAGVFMVFLLGGCGEAFLRLPHDGPEDGYVKVVDHAAGRYRLVVFSPGIPAEPIDVHRVKGRLSLHFYDTRFREPLDSWGSGEAQEPISIDYSDLEHGIVRVTRCTWDPQDSVTYKPGTTPLSLITLRALPNGTCELRATLLLKSEPLDEKRMRDLVEAAKLVAEDSGEETRLHEPLAHLRNMSPSNPALLLQVFNDLLSTGKFDGAACVLVLAYRDEVCLMRDLLDCQALPGTAERAGAGRGTGEAAARCARIRNENLVWDHSYAGTYPTLGPDEEWTRRTEEDVDGYLLEALGDPRRWIAAHVLLTERHLLPSGCEPGRWDEMFNGLRVGLDIKGNAYIDEWQRVPIRMYWLERLKRP